MKEILNRYRDVFKDKKFVWSAIFSICILFVSLVINYFAGVYATERASSSVTDIILSNIRVFDVDGIFIYGSYLFWIFLILLFILRPKKINFTLKSLALFIIIRAAFVTMTHIGPFPTQLPVDPNSFITYFTLGGDLFFSGHTGIPFLMALVFWKENMLRYIFLCISILFAAVVLLAHMHYTIDVAAAFFITYTIFHLAEKFFKKDREIFNSSI